MDREESELEDKQALQDFLLDIDCLNELSGWISRFNIFDILKIARTEIRHSNVLAWLLDPSGNHGLGGQVLEGFLRDIVEVSGDSSSAFSILTMDVEDFIIQREWQNIDILAVSPRNHSVLCVENKIDSGENGDQLHSYLETVDKTFPDYKKCFVFLSPYGMEASDSERWITMSYSDILDILDPIVKRASLSDDASLLINNYLEIVRRDIVEDHELEEVCRRIYSKHSRALDLIFENLPDRASEFKDVFTNWAESKAKEGAIQFNPAFSNKRYMHFQTPYMSDLFPNIPNTKSGWPNYTGHYFYELECDRGEKYHLKLEFSSQGMPAEQKDMVSRIAKICTEQGFGDQRRLNPDWTWRMQFRTETALVDEDIDVDAICKQLDSFLEKALEFEEHLQKYL